jgi:hypothetical protein
MIFSGLSEKYTVSKTLRTPTRSNYCKLEVTQLGFSNLLIRSMILRSHCHHKVMTLWLVICMKSCKVIKMPSRNKTRRSRCKPRIWKSYCLFLSTSRRELNCQSLSMVSVSGYSSARFLVSIGIIMKVLISTLKKRSLNSITRTTFRKCSLPTKAQPRLKPSKTWSRQWI